MELKITVTVIAEGTIYHAAELVTLNETDGDSEPGNTNFREDDIALACVTVPYHICAADGDSVKMWAPLGLTTYAWFKDTGNGPVMVSNDSVFYATEAGSYTFLATQNACAAGAWPSSQNNPQGGNSNCVGLTIEGTAGLPG